MIPKLITLALLSRFASSSRLPNVPAATFGPSPAPFELEVDPRFIDDVHNRVLHARPPVPLDGLAPVDADGPGVDDFNRIRDFWVHEYNWNSTQRSINEKSVLILI